MYDYLIEIVGVDGSDCLYEVKAPNEHRARRIAVDQWNSETHAQPILSIETH